MSRRKKVVVLLSAGLDSTVNAFEAKKHHHEVVLAVTFDYGQRAAKKEVECSAKIAQYLGVPHKVISLPWFKEFSSSALLNKNIEVPSGDKVKITDHEASVQSAKAVWVPNRNGIFLNIAAGFAESIGADVVMPGFNREEAETFPDNSKAFLEQTSKALAYSTANQVKAGCFTSHLNKIEMVKLGEGLKIPWNLIWPCYQDGDKWCGQCESCKRSLRAFDLASVDVSACVDTGA